ncbi:MAG TPA: hypothetical protein VK907_03100 [Phnomibacter sp.]|nr:hypothetical protein [Phnomibacter sp.]
MYRILTVVFSIGSLGLFAQSTDAVKKAQWQFATIAQGGFIAGASEYNYAAQLIPALKHGPWLLGIGGGIDNYVLPGFPVFAHGQYHPGKRKVKPFAYAQAGPHFPWAKNEWEQKSFDGQDLYDLKTGWLAEGGLGYSFPFIKSTRLLTSLGYSVKQVKYDEAQLPFWIWPWPGPGAELTYHHQKLTMNRLVLKLGVQF